MSFVIPAPWLTLFAVLSLTLGLLSAVFSVILRTRQRDLVTTLSFYNKEVRALTSSAVGVGARLVEMESEVQRLARNQHQAKLEDPVRETYQQASTLLEKGVSIDEVIALTGLPRAEVVFLHKLSVRYN